MPSARKDGVRITHVRDWKMTKNARRANRRYSGKDPERSWVQVGGERMLVGYELGSGLKKESEMGKRNKEIRSGRRKES